MTTKRKAVISVTCSVSALLAIVGGILGFGSWRGAVQAHIDNPAIHSGVSEDEKAARAELEGKIAVAHSEAVRCCEAADKTSEVVRDLTGKLGEVVGELRGLRGELADCRE